MAGPRYKKILTIAMRQCERWAGVQEGAKIIRTKEGTAGKARAEEKYITCVVCKDKNYDGDGSSERKMVTE